MTPSGERFVETVGRELKRCSTLESLCANVVASLTPPVYSSFDIRDAGFKIAPIDANLFPAGWNNLAPESLARTQQLFKQWFQKYMKVSGCRLLIVSENHTRNKYYFENLLALSRILTAAGFETKVGAWQHPEWASTTTAATVSGNPLVVEPINIRACRVTLDQGWTPDVILMNNDCSTHPGDIWDCISVPIVPSPSFGWHRRRKSWFFECWNRHAEQLATCLSLDPWNFQVRTSSVASVDFKTEQGVKRLAEVVDEMIEFIATEYRTRNISRTPSVFVKHASGTYGIGVMTVSSGAELLSMNRKDRDKMSVGKGKRFIDEVIVQETIPTAQRTDIPDEPVIYVVGYDVAGGFLRTHVERTDQESLNRPGMVTAPLNTISSDIMSVYQSMGFHAAVVLSQELAEYAP